MILHLDYQLRRKLKIFHYSIVHTAGRNLVVADLLSRKPVFSLIKDDEVIAEDYKFVAINTVDMIPASEMMLQYVQHSQLEDAVGK